MAQKSRAERVEPLKEFPLKGGGKYRFNLEGRSEVKCPNWPECPSFKGVSVDGWRQVQIPFVSKLKDYTGRCSSCERRSKKKTEPIFHLSGAVLLRAVRDPEDGDRVAYLCIDCCPTFERVEAWFAECGVDIGAAHDVTDSALRTALKDLGAECDELHYVRPVDVERREQFGGRCERCRDRARFNWLRLSGGGWARRDYEEPTKGIVICPDCMGHRHVHIPSGKNLEVTTGRCPQCASRGNRKLKEIITHLSGAICLQFVRDPEHTRDRAAFICSNWAGLTNDMHPPDCLGVDFGWFNQFDDDNWGGRCGNCARRFEDNPRTVKTDWPIYAWAETRGPDGPFVEILAWVRYSKGGAKEVPVWFVGCEHEAPLSRSYIATLKSAHKNRKTVFSRWCPPCVKNPEQLAATLQAQAQNGNRQKNEELTKSESTSKAGRPRKFTDEEAFNAIDNLGARLSVSLLARTLKCARPTINDWVYAKGFSNLPDLAKARRSRV
jgi:Zn finger protein HypA/HybF involved in hydrogenase expression